MESTAETLDRLCGCLSDPTRRQLFESLRREPGMTTGQLAAVCPGLTRWAVMKHLAVLRDAGLVQTMLEGPRRRHYVQHGALQPLIEWLEHHAGDRRSGL